MESCEDDSLDRNTSRCHNNNNIFLVFRDESGQMPIDQTRSETRRSLREILNDRFTFSLTGNSSLAYYKLTYQPHTRASHKREQYKRVRFRFRSSLEEEIGIIFAETFHCCLGKHNNTYILLFFFFFYSYSRKTFYFYFSCITYFYVIYRQHNTRLKSFDLPNENKHVCRDTCRL